MNKTNMIDEKFFKEISDCGISDILFYMACCDFAEQTIGNKKQRLELLRTIKKL